MVDGERSLDAIIGLADLSKNFELSDPENPRRLATNPGARWIEENFGKRKEVRRVTVIEDGKLVADYRGEGVGPDDTFNLFSTTKAFTSMLLGIVVQQTDLSITDTLEDIFKDTPLAWSRLEDYPEVMKHKKSIRLEEILTMTSGLVSMIGGRKGVMTMKAVTLADAPGSDLQRALLAPYYDPSKRGEFHYMPSSNILSYIIKEKTGLSPLKFAITHVFPKLGINPHKMSWDKNSDGIETSYSQLYLTTHQMCKIGQLYLQDGYHGPKAFKPLLEEDWICKSHTKHVFAEKPFGHWYGYLWALYDRDYHGNHQAGDIWAAPGFNGQLIAFSRDTNRVCAISRSPIPPLGSEELKSYKRDAIKLLGTTMSFTTTAAAAADLIPKAYIRNARTGKMIKNPEYIEFMQRQK